MNAVSDALSSLVSVAFHGAAYGMVLYVISVGLSVTMGLMGFVNLAHGVFAMMGGLVLSAASTRLGLPFAVGILLSFSLVAAVSLVLERVLYSRLYTAGELPQVLFTMALIFIAMALVRLTYGTLTISIAPPDYLRGQVEIFGRDFPTYKVFVIAAGAAIFAMLWYGVERTRLGAMVRASVDNRAMAQSVGINTQRLFLLVFGLGSGLAGLGGALGSDLLPIHWSYPLEHLVYFMIVVSIGGVGSLSGPFVAAMLIGLADTACKYWVPELGAFLIYLFTIGVLLVLPNGLFGAARS